MATFTITVPDADVPRLQAAIASTGLTPRQVIAQYLKSLVQGFEQQQDAQTFATGYTPIGAS